MGVTINTGRDGKGRTSGIVDPGTGLYKMQEGPVTFTGPISTDPTDAFENPGDVKHESLEHTEGPVGNFKNPAKTERYEDPTISLRTKAVDPDEVEDKAVSRKPKAKPKTRGSS